jgi:dTDP-4-dehydrorhamnose reductase|tara:strand:+ start:7646 stop:8479 length:834 start_codon:yes stop_codon:yes gene_type:complete
MRPEIIFGGTGLLGSNYLLNKKNKIIYNIIHKKRAYNAKNIKIDILKLEEFIKKNKVQIILNFAALTNIEECEKNKKATYETNVKLPMDLSILAYKLKIKFVHISTDHFICKDYPIKEKSKVTTCNSYARTKLLAEKKILEFNKNALIIRTNFFKSESKKKSFYEKIIEATRRNKFSFLFHDVYFNPVSIKFLLETMNKLISKKATGIFNVSSDGFFSKYEFGLSVLKKKKLKKNYIIKSNFAKRKDLVKRPFNMTLCNKKLKQFLKIKTISLINQV